jgi:hypothetical protein
MTNYAGQPGVDGPQGWNKLFGQPDAPWPDFMNHVQVLAAAGIANTPDDILIKAFAKLGQKHISFAIESLAQSRVNKRSSAPAEACGPLRPERSLVGVNVLS